MADDIRQLENGNVLIEVSNSTADWLLHMRENPGEKLDSCIERLLDLRDMMNSTLWVILVGDVTELEAIVGPFDSEAEARAWAHGNAGEDRYESWSSMALTRPTDDDEEPEDDT